MNPLIVVLFIFGFVISSTGASLLFKVAADTAGWTAFRYFLLGNFAGVWAPVCLMFALKGTNANIVYAVCYGGGFCALQIAAFYLFRQPLSAWQWAGVGVVGIGILLLQIRPVL